MTFARQLLVVCFAAFAADLVASLHVITLVRGSILLAMATVFILHLAVFPAHHWFVNLTSARDRFLVTMAGALGAALGTLTVMLAT